MHLDRSLAILELPITVGLVCYPQKPAAESNDQNDQRFHHGFWIHFFQPSFLNFIRFQGKQQGFREL